MTMNHLQFPLAQSAIAIILNGQRDCLQKLQQHWQNYQCIIVCDGAWHDVATLLNLSEATEKVVVLGDGDSIQLQEFNTTKHRQNRGKFPQYLEPRTANKEIFSNFAVNMRDGFFSNCISNEQNIVQLPKHFIHITEQDSTDFEKALRWLLKQREEEQVETDELSSKNPPKSPFEKGGRLPSFVKRGWGRFNSKRVLIKKIEADKPNIDVYWANGGELDHTLGNMALSAKYYQDFSLHFYTDNQYYCYIKDSLRISGVKGKTLSIFPFPKLWIKATQGLTYPMTDYLMQMHTQQSLRNHAKADEVLIEGKGEGFVFVAYPLAT